MGSLPGKGVLKAKNQVVERNNVNAGPGPHQQTVGESCIDIKLPVEGIILNVSPIHIAFHVDGQRDVPELFQRHIFPSPRPAENSFLQGGLVEKKPRSLYDVNFIAANNLSSVTQRAVQGVWLRRGGTDVGRCEVRYIVFPFEVPMPRLSDIEFQLIDGRTPQA